MAGWSESPPSASGRISRTRCSSTSARKSAFRGSSLEDRPDLLERVEPPVVDAMTELFQPRPVEGRAKRFSPERKRAALSGTLGIDGAALVPENAVAVVFQLEHRFAVLVPGDVAPSKSAD